MTAGDGCDPGSSSDFSVPVITLFDGISIKWRRGGTGRHVGGERRKGKGERGKERGSDAMPRERGIDLELIEVDEKVCGGRWQHAPRFH